MAGLRAPDLTPAAVDQLPHARAGAQIMAKLYGVERVLVPGQREFEVRADRETNGVPVDQMIIERLDRFADDLGITRLAGQVLDAG